LALNHISKRSNHEVFVGIYVGTLNSAIVSILKTNNILIVLGYGLIVRELMPKMFVRV